jgi:hypothetical protein
MRVAWFTADASRLAITRSDAGDLAAELAPRHQVDCIDEALAHSFLARHARRPYDVTIFELGDTPAHRFMWAYLFHYPGVLLLQARTLARARSASLVTEGRTNHLRAERALGGWNLLRAPLLASRLVVVRDDYAARELRESSPEIAVSVVPVGVHGTDLQPSAGVPRLVVVGDRGEVIDRASSRARAAGAAITVTHDATALRNNDIVVALEWPPTGAAPVAALRAMASGLPAIVFETEAVAAWPMLDPQTWQPRGLLTSAAPAAISIDPRDEEHSLMLAIKRLAGDAGLRAGIGNAARNWAAQHANVRAAGIAWASVLDDVHHRSPPARPAELPCHLAADGTARLRQLLDEMGVTVDFLS